MSMPEPFDTNKRPQYNESYVPQDASKMLTDDASHQKTKGSGGGTSSGGATVVVPNDSLIQSTAQGGIQGAYTQQASTSADIDTDRKRQSPGDVWLEKPLTDVDPVDFATLAQRFTDSL
ncbi:MAG TPA: hypothetical protein VN457_07560, partial [Chlamydiales bacterium]|nr:hypothetical protein [Chlamydiales bacterium]